MSSSRLSQLLRHSKSLPIKLPQNSNLIIRTPSPSLPPNSQRQPIRVNVNILPEWRDDGYITLEQVLPPLSLPTQVQHGHNNGNTTNTIDNGHGQYSYSDLDQEIDWTVDVENQQQKKELTNVNILIDYKRKNNITKNGESDGDRDDIPAQEKSGGGGDFIDGNATKTNNINVNVDAKLKLMTDDGTIIHDADKIKELLSGSNSDTTDTNDLIDTATTAGTTKPHHPNYRQVHYSDNVVHLTKMSDHDHANAMFVKKGEGGEEERSDGEILSDLKMKMKIPSITLNAKIPEKCNVSCHLHGGGNITVRRKLEGEHGFHFVTASGTICVDKLRGDVIDLVCDEGGLIHVKKSCEAQELNVRIGGGGEGSGAKITTDDCNHRGNRFRSKMINVSNGTIQVYEDGSYTSESGELMKKLDNDDGLSIIDISSIYASQSGEGVHLEVPKRCCSPSSPCDASMNAGEENGEYPRKVRVKSNHGHISVKGVTSIYTSRQADEYTSLLEDEYGQRCALVTLGGVNGSFDVLLESRVKKDKSESIDYQAESTSPTTAAAAAAESTTFVNESNFSNKPLASNVHVDSLSPGQISALVCEHGDVGLTLDRKIETDIRLLSSPLMNCIDPNILLEENEDDVLEPLIEHDDAIEESNYSNGGNTEGRESDEQSFQIMLETNAFSGLRSSDFNYIEYVHGSVENISEEPSSRFDVKTKGIKSATSGSVGKINIEGAAGQALEGFTGGSTEDFQRPLLVAGTDGKIKLESLSWFGAISRRYGVKDEVGDLGRQAKSSVSNSNARGQ